MDYSTAFDILFLLAAVYFWPGIPGQQAQSSPSVPGRTSSSLVPPSPKSPHTPPIISQTSDTLAVPRIVLHGDPQQAPPPILKKHGHKRKSVSFSLSSMAELGAGDSAKQPVPSPNAQHRPPTPFHRAPPTPSEILALSDEPMPKMPSFEDIPTPLTADMLISKESTDSMGVKKGWLV